MGIRSMISIYCDRCVTHYEASRRDVREVRDKARLEGWRHDGETGQDLCPGCHRSR